MTSLGHPSLLLGIDCDLEDASESAWATAFYCKGFSDAAPNGHIHFLEKRVDETNAVSVLVHEYLHHVLWRFIDMMNNSDSSTACMDIIMGSTEETESFLNFDKDWNMPKKSTFWEKVKSFFSLRWL